MKKILMLIVLLLGIQQAGLAQFVHPGGLHTRSDLERMKTHVHAGDHPWIDSWRELQRDPLAQADWKSAAHPNMGFSQQRADLDARAAYLNALRWTISGDTKYADCAVRICNAWSSSVNHAPTGRDTPGLIGIPIFNFALAAELLRIYPGWQPQDFNRFKHMMVQYGYPVCHDFLVNHNGRCISYYWTNWDACNIGEKTDALNFTRRIVKGNFTFTARLLKVHWSGRDKIGLMVRESAAPEARTLALTLGLLGNRQCRFGTRMQPSAAMTWQAVWFRIQRKDNVFTGYQSLDNANGFKVSSNRAPLADQCLIGFAITGQKPNVFNTSAFDHVTVETVLK